MNWKVIDKSVLGKPKVVGAGSAKTEAEAHAQADAKLTALGGKLPVTETKGIAASVKVKASAQPTEILVAKNAHGETIVRVGSSLVAKAASGYSETIRVNGARVRWVQPTQFTNAFKRAADLYVRNPRNHATKLADVPQTLESIWNEVTDDLGPAPQVELKGEGAAPEASVSDSKPSTQKENNSTPSENKQTWSDSGSSAAAPKEEKTETAEPKEEKSDSKGESRLDKLRERRDPDGIEKDKPWSKRNRR